MRAKTLSLLLSGMLFSATALAADYSPKPTVKLAAAGYVCLNCPPGGNACYPNTCDAPGKNCHVSGQACTLSGRATGCPSLPPC
jgi:hypothetical protein